MQLVSKVSFFYSADLCTRCARAANFPSRKKKVLLLLICCINNYLKTIMGIYFQKSLFVCDGSELYFLSSKIVEKLKLNNENAINKLCCGHFRINHKSVVR
jgi:hypothetical protein